MSCAYHCASNAGACFNSPFRKFCLSCLYIRHTACLGDLCLHAVTVVCFGIASLLFGSFVPAGVFLNTRGLHCSVGNKLCFCQSPAWHICTSCHFQCQLQWFTTFPCRSEVSWPIIKEQKTFLASHVICPGVIGNNLIGRGVSPLKHCFLWKYASLGHGREKGSALFPRTAPDMAVQSRVFLLFLVVSTGLVVMW